MQLENGNVIEGKGGGVRSAEKVLWSTTVATCT